MAQIRIMHYLNQFFAGIGAEDKAATAVGFIDGPVGPGLRLQNLMGDEAKITVTAYCGDNYFADHTGEALAAIRKIAGDNKADLVVAGPAFSAGRYGFACVEIGHSLSTASGLKCVSAMHVENPGLDGYRQYKDKGFYVLPTGASARNMEDALSGIAKFVKKLASGSDIGPAAQEGYIPRGFRRLESVSQSGVERVIDMLLARQADRSYTSEIPIEGLEGVPVAAAINDLKGACIALASTAGVILAGNPDGFKMYKNTHWKKYSVAGLTSMTDARWEALHGGYNTAFMNANPNYGVPLDACRKLEKEGVLKKLYDYFYTVPGNQGAISDMKRLGREMGEDMKAAGVDGVLLVST